MRKSSLSRYFFKTSTSYGILGQYTYLIRNPSTFKVAGQLNILSKDKSDAVKYAENIVGKKILRLLND